MFVNLFVKVSRVWAMASKKKNEQEKKLLSNAQVTNPIFAINI